MVNSVMERSLRETKMRKSVGLGELHQYVGPLHFLLTYSDTSWTQYDEPVYSDSGYGTGCEADGEGFEC